MKKYTVLFFALLFSCSTTQPLSEEDKEVRVQKAYQMGLSHANKGNLTLAEAYFREAISLDPKALEGYSGLGALFAHAGKTNEAMEVYQEAIQHLGERPEIFEDLAFVYGKEDNSEKAIEMLMRANELRLKFPASLKNGEKIQRNREVIEHLQKLLHPD